MEHKSNESSGMVLRIVSITLHGLCGRRIKTYAFLDDGSSVTLINKKLATELKLNGLNKPLCLKWTGKTTRQENSSQRIEIKISSQSSDAEIFALKNIRTVEDLKLLSQ